VNHDKFNTRPFCIAKLFESMDSISGDMINNISRPKSALGSYWNDINQSIWDLQDLLVNFHNKIENLSLEDLSCKAICSFETYTQKFIDRKRMFISNAPYEIRNAKYNEAQERAGNTARLLKETGEKLKQHFYQLIYEEVSTKKEKFSISN